MFIFNFNYIKDLARITMDEKCNGIYCEAETDRYQIAKNSYNLLMPNDVFNSKTYTIFVFIISIMIFIYYYRMLKLYDYTDEYFNKILYFLIHAFLLTILLWMIIYRYTPNDEQGYLNYFKIKWKDTANDYDTIRYVASAICSLIFVLALVVVILKYKYSITKLMMGRIYILLAFIAALLIPIITNNNKTFDIIYALLISLIPLCVVLIKFDAIINGKGLIIITTLFCFIASIILVIYLMNIVMTFSNNTTPILKTKPLTWSLRNSLNNHVNYRITDTNTEHDNIKIYASSLGNNISSVLDIYLAFEELSKIVYNTLTGGVIPAYTTKLKDTINKSYIYVASKEKYTPTLSLIFDKKVSIPSDYGDIITSKDVEDVKTSNEQNKKEGKPTTDVPTVDPRSLENPEFSSSHEYNSNDRNTSYVYTADISYDNANLFYEKYWDMKDTDYEFLWRYDYGLPVFLKNFLLSGKPNLTKLIISVGVFIVFVIIVVAIASFASNFTNFNVFWNVFLENIKILAPFIALVVFVTYIIVFILFNTNFNKNVVYKCLDCSYKRSLNKLNTIVSPYIRMYDNKITGGNKNYTHHYIIANVFYSILSGNINLIDDVNLTSINIIEDDMNYTTIDNSNGLKFADMNSSILSNDNQYREYYKTRFSNLYKEKYDTTEVTNIYAVFTKIFTNNSLLTTPESIDLYFQNILKRQLIRKIYLIIKKCIELFDEEKFNNNMIYYNNRDASPISIESYKNFKFYKGKNKLIPHKFILVLKTNAEIVSFVGTNVNNFDDILSTKLNIADASDKANMTGILEDITNEDSTNQNKDIQDKNMIKIIAKYLLIMGHINYNRISYNAESVTASITQEKVDENKKNIYILQTLGLYRLISNVSYADTFKIDDTFGKTILITDSKYYTLTYMYNYLDTKYVILSSNKNNNYLLNIIKSINNTLNNDNKTTVANDIKEARYLFSDRINDYVTEKQYENEDAILMKAHYISTTFFEFIYFGNMLILLLYITGTIFFKIK